MEKAEKSFQKSIEYGVINFAKELDRQRLDSLDKIQKSAQKNIDGFDIEIHLPDAKSISLDTSVSGILNNAVEEKTKTVTRHRRKSGAWGIDGNTDTDELIPFNQTRFFPNASIQYNIIPQVFVNANYNKKISLPNTSALNPNNTNYQNPNVSFLVTQI